MSVPTDGVRLAARLRFRFYVVLAIGMLGPAALVAALGWSRLEELDARLVRDQEEAAALVAARVDAEVSHDLATLQRIATVARAPLAHGPESSPADVAGFARALREGWLQFHQLGGLVLLDAAGNVRAAEPPRSAALELPRDLPALRSALANGRPAVSGAMPGDGLPRAWAFVGVLDWQSRPAGVIGALLEHTTAHQARTFGALRLARGGRALLVDSAGVPLARAGARTPLTEACAAELATVARVRRAISGVWPACTTPDGSALVGAFVPVPSAPWGVLVLEPEQGVLATVGLLPRSFPVLALAVLAGAGLFAWGAARSVTRPVGVLNAAAERIAGGVFEPEIPELGSDEVGRLGRSLERMRAALRDLVAERERHAEELERRVAERTRELAEANASLRERDEARAKLLRMVITAQEDERKRVARELHDDTSQNLAVLVMGIESAIQALRAGGATPRLDEVKALAVHALDELHRLIHDLRPAVLDDLGLFPAVRWYAEKTLKSRGVAVRCETGEEPRLPAAWDIALFRMCQEAVNNVARHADAETVLIQLGAEGGELRIEIEDDGRGFDPAAPRRDGDRAHWGLMGIGERVEALGGTVRLDSAPGHGTRLEIRVPLPQETAPAPDARAEKGAR